MRAFPVVFEAFFKWLRFQSGWVYYWYLAIVWTKCGYNVISEATPETRCSVLVYYIYIAQRIVLSRHGWTILQIVSMKRSPWRRRRVSAFGFRWQLFQGHLWLVLLLEWSWCIFCQRGKENSSIALTAIINIHNRLLFIQTVNKSCVSLTLNYISLLHLWWGIVISLCFCRYTTNGVFLLFIFSKIHSKHTKRNRTDNQQSPMILDEW